MRYSMFVFFVRFQGLDEESGAQSVGKIGLKLFTTRTLYCKNKDNQISCMVETFQNTSLI